MGSSKPRDSATMNTASAGATAADASLAKQADQSTAYAKQAHDTLFGPSTTSQGAAGIAQGGGTLSKFLDPNSLNVSSPTGAYGLQFNKATENIANQGVQNRGAINRGFASRGFGNMPAGFTADQSRQELADESNQKGAAFTDFAGKSYADALNNFWNATNIASGSGAANTNAAIAADSSAANNYSSLYGTASTPKPNTMGQLLGAGLQGGAQVGSAAISAACPCEGSLILMMDGTEKKIEDCRKGDLFQGIDGRPCELVYELEPIMVPCVMVRCSPKDGGMELIGKVSSTHTFIMASGGYEYASDSWGIEVPIAERESLVPRFGSIESVEYIGRQLVYQVRLNGSHSYRVDGIWSLV